MDGSTTAPMSGRKAQAARNDRLIVDAARAVFVADPTAPIAAVAERAGVGISALYRRYPSKEELLRRLCSDGLRRYIAAAEAMLADDGDPWEAFARFMRTLVDADSTSLTRRLAGTFTPTEDLYRDAATAQELNEQIFARLRTAGVVRPDLDVNDIGLILEQLAGIHLGDKRRTNRLRHRYLALYLDAVRRPGETPLPGPPPTWSELAERWDT
ncbi:MAG TPA: TetR/AcrR family transcriptional regulator [Streptosporangiaceae bacterium]|nr:TetR/AcrR family transcriptional regulator [Streptosporangiaceae bacterium]